MILIAPIKYYKRHNVIKDTEYKYLWGFISNRKYYQATAAALPIIHWLKQYDNNRINNIYLQPIDYSFKTNEYVYNDSLKINKINILFSSVNKDIRITIDKTKIGILCNLDGSEYNNNNKKVRVTPYYHPDILAHFRTASYGLNRMQLILVRAECYNEHGMFLTKQNYYEYLPLFVTNCYYKYMDWFEIDILNKTYDGNGSYINDKDFLKKCLIYTCLTYSNKIRSLYGSDGRLYRNELCFDDNTIASNKLKELQPYLTDQEIEIINIYKELLSYIKNNNNYNKDFTYGTYQIIQDFDKRDPYIKERYKLLNDKLKEYYLDNILQKLKEYELLK